MSLGEGKPLPHAVSTLKLIEPTADGKFPTANNGIGLPPPPSVENPGQVFPKSDPYLGVLSPLYNTYAAISNRGLTAPRTPPNTNGENFIGNPFLMNMALCKLDHAVGEVIAILESEESASGAGENEGHLMQKFLRWREELDMLRGGLTTPSVTSRASPRTRSRSPQPGGIFID
ncbi:hypothetical protein H0H81_009114 [Sphagnurus paluster]|uniref:Uncharacterized protein n=1 Tax=Sphagnurus paluster TaxID=117069 RepID=A0A9P7KI61_9AGAR|nr:hypothetical protein H0H81_009114 [Sphagnurus paluster]